MITKSGIILGITAFLLLVVSGSCDRDRNNPGWDYFPDMFYSEAYESYTPNPNFEDGKTMQEPVEGTVARGEMPFEYTIEPEDRIRAGEELANPFEGDPSVVSRGKEVYEAFCLNCHGTKGEGQGYLHTSGLYIAVPRSLVNETAQNLKDGEIFHTITLGFGSMGAHGSQLRPEDRWKTINYIRMVLQENANEEK